MLRCNLLNPNLKLFDLIVISFQIQDNTVLIHPTSLSINSSKENKIRYYLGKNEKYLTMIFPVYSSKHHVINEIRSGRSKVLFIECCFNGSFFLYPPSFKEYIITMSLKWSEFSLSMKSFLICTSIYCMGGLRLRSCLILLIQTSTMCSAWIFFILCLFLHPRL